MKKDSKKNILGRLQKALEQKAEKPYPEIKDAEGIFPPPPQDLVKMFSEQFQALGGIFYYCKDHSELIKAIGIHTADKSDDQLFCADARLIHLLKHGGFDKVMNASDKMKEGSVSITSCMKLLARTGSVLFSAVQAEGRSYAIAPDTHIVIASENQLLYNVSEALEEHIRKFDPLPSMISLTSGASRTADIEKTLVMGAHGPKELIVVMMPY